jgi:predicted esterase YcpF (UPF0227 family)
MLYFIHGYLSSPTSAKATLFAETLKAIPIKYRDGAPEDIVISDCLQKISEAISKDPAPILIGSSLGGFLAASTAFTHPNIKTLFLLNPAIPPPSTNVRKHSDVPRRILGEMMAEQRLFSKKISAEIIIFRGTNDMVVPDIWVYLFAAAQEATVVFLHDDHRFSRTMNRLPGLMMGFMR